MYGEAGTSNRDGQGLIVTELKWLQRGIRYIIRVDGTALFQIRSQVTHVRSDDSRCPTL